MICGPMHPFGRDGLRQLLRERSGAIEHGLRLLLEDLDCSRGALPPVDGVCRDAIGRAVLVILADEEDVALPARVLQTQAFCARNAAALERALPELGVSFEPCRLLVVGLAFERTAVAILERLLLPDLEVCEVEPFRVGGQDRLAVRMLLGARVEPELDASVDPGLRARWAELTALFGRLDPAVRVVGDRFARRASLRGRNLCEFWCHEGQLVAVVPGASPRTLVGPGEVRSFRDQVLRRYLELVEGGETEVVTAVAPQAGAAPVASRAAGSALRGVTLESLRQSLQASRLTREEYSALSGPTAEGNEPKSG